MTTEIDNLQRGHEKIEDRLDRMVSPTEIKEQKETLKDHAR
jgi:hypothetical protein